MKPRKTKASGRVGKKGELLPYVPPRIVEKRILEERRRAAARMDASRKKTAGVRFDSTLEIRKLRDAP